MFAVARDAFANFEGFQLHLIEINDLATLAETAFHEQTRECFLGLVGRGKIDVPEVDTRVENGDGVNKPFGLAIDFGDNAGAHGFGLVAFEFAVQGELLAGKQFFLKTDDAAVAADEKGLRILAYGHARGGEPRRLYLQLQADAVALTNTFGDHGRNRKWDDYRFRLTCAEAASRAGTQALCRTH